jgi:hypothetical protein
MNAKIPGPKRAKRKADRSAPAPIGRIIRGIATEAFGVMFRSRLEATWAHCFSGLGIQWAYEPEDLEYYLPDFNLKFERKPLLIEVKPLNEDIELAKSKIETSGWLEDAAIVISAESRFIGEIYEKDLGWDRAVLTFCLKCKKPTIVSEGGNWSCRNCPEGGSRDLWWAFDGAAQWAEAKNATQWRPSNK